MAGATVSNIPNMLNLHLVIARLRALLEENIRVRARIGHAVDATDVDAVEMGYKHSPTCR
jgi:hypothetical protein